MTRRSMWRGIAGAFGAAMFAACGGSDPTGSGAGPANGPTYYGDVAPILATQCASCHVEGGIAPFPLLTYEDAKMAGPTIKSDTASRKMPPWNLDNSGSCSTFENARWLTDDEIATLGAWVDAEYPMGDPSQMPPPPAEPPKLSVVSKTLDMGVSYTPDASKEDDYRCFIVDPGLVEDTFVTAYQVNPGDKRVVHHMILFANDTPEDDQAVADLDAAEPGDGYTCYGGPGANGSRFTVGWAPGGGATFYPDGTGLRLKAGRKVVMQIHYNLANGAFPDRTTIDLTLAPSVQKEALISRVAALNLNLPPGQSLATATANLPVPKAVGQFTVWGVAPHMHKRGRTMDVSYDDGAATTCMTKVSDWNFHWQSFGMFASPITLSGGGTMSITCGYDTSFDTKTVTWGEGTDDEMCINFFYVTQ